MQLSYPFPLEMIYRDDINRYLPILFRLIYVEKNGKRFQDRSSKDLSKTLLAFPGQDRS